MRLLIQTSFSALAIAILATPSYAVAVDAFDTYAAGSIVDQSGPTPPWEAGVWEKNGDPGVASADTGALVYSYSYSDEVTGGRGTVSRVYDASAGVPAISFDITLDDLTSLVAGGTESETSTNAGDYMNLFARNGNQGDFGGSGSWLIRGGNLKGGGEGAGQQYDPAAPFNWYAFNYDAGVGNGFTDATVVDTGIAMAEGVTYAMTVSFPGPGEWNLVIDDGTNVYSSALGDGPFGFRSADSSPSRDVHFGFSDRGTGMDAAKGLQFTVDNFTTVPEPASCVLLLVSVLAPVLPRRR